MRRKVLAVVTGTRAEYGLLRPVILKLLRSEHIIPRIYVTGAHLSAEYGSTVTEIEADGVPIAECIPILKFGHGPTATAQTIAETVRLFSAVFEAQKPDGVLILGDRYEMFGTAIAAAAQRVPILHISGGDVTLGAADEYYRHCITKMAAVHFPSCADSANRLVRMGEPPSRVHMVGGLGDENIRTMKKLSAQELSEALHFDLTRPFGLVTFHPQTAGDGDPVQQMQALLAAMDETPDLRWLITKSNADEGGSDINALIDDWVATRTGRAKAFFSLGVQRYLSAMKAAALVAGNSSSGVVETPSFGVPTVNIGARQGGRTICANVICCTPEKGTIKAAIARALTPAFRAVAANAVSPYDGGDTSGRIVTILEQVLYDPEISQPKKFYDGPLEGYL